MPLGAPIGREVSWTLSRWLNHATQLVSAEILERAKQLAAELMAPHALIMREDDGSLGVAYGLLTTREAAMPIVARLAEAGTRHVLLELGQALSMTQQDHEAARVLGAVAHVFTLDAPARAAAAAAHPDAEADARSGRFEREVYTYWASAAQRAAHGRDSAEQERAVYRLAVRRRVWRHPMQRPLEHFQPALTRRPFWDAASLPAAVALEAAFPQILREVRALMGQADENFATYHSRVVDAGGWSDVQL